MNPASEERGRATETYTKVLRLEDLEKKLACGQGLTLDDLRFLVETVRRLQENDIPYLNERLRKSAKSELLGLSIMLWIATPIAFLSIPLVGFACALIAMFSTIGYLKARAYVT